MENFRYSIVIRTLGKAGAAYQKELDSIDRQTVQPERIIVYLAEGYGRPKETIGREQIVYVKKGMVAQRALDYREVDTPYVLMLDDDVFLPESAVEKMAEVLLSEDADCVAADTFQNHKMSFISKMKAAVSNWAFPMFHSEWAIKIQRTGSFLYNISPPERILSIAECRRSMFTVEDGRFCRNSFL